MRVAHLYACSAPPSPIRPRAPWRAAARAVAPQPPVAAASGDASDSAAHRSIRPRGRRTTAVQFDAGTARDKAGAPLLQPLSSASAPHSRHDAALSLSRSSTMAAAQRAFAAAATAALLLATGAAAAPNGGKGIQLVKSVGGGGWTEGCVRRGGGARGSARLRGAPEAGLNLGSMLSGRFARAPARIGALRALRPRHACPRSQAQLRSAVFARSFGLVADCITTRGSRPTPPTPLRSAPRLPAASAARQHRGIGPAAPALCQIRASDAFFTARCSRATHYGGDPGE